MYDRKKAALRDNVNSRLIHSGYSEHDREVRNDLLTSFNYVVDGHDLPPEDILVSYLSNMRSVYPSYLEGPIVFDGDRGAPHSCVGAMRIVADEIDKTYENCFEAKKLLEFTKIFEARVEGTADTKVAFERNGATYQAHASVLGLNYYLDMNRYESSDTPYDEAIKKVELCTTEWRTQSEDHRRTFTLLKNAYAHASMITNSLEIQTSKARSTREVSKWLGKNPDYVLP